MNANIILVVWRESLEAMLIVGILYAWLQRNPSRRGMRGLWLGIGGGLLLAAGLGLLILGVAGEIEGELLEHFQTGMLFVACALITHMVLWMKQHGRHLHGLMQEKLDAQAGNPFGIALIAALAIGREGAETVIFLYGASLESSGLSGMGGFVNGAATGFAVALLCAWLSARGLRLIPMRHFYRVSGFILLIFAAALLSAAVDRLIGTGTLPPLLEPLWDSSALLDDGSTGGRIAASLLGYRAQPSLMLMLVYPAYWLLVARALRRQST